jgi:hypothetical protein
LDERVQEAACSEFRDFSNKKKPLIYWLSCMRVCIPDKKEIDLESKELTLQGIENWLNSTIESFLKRYKLPPLLVVHQGILDVVGLKDAQPAQEWIDNLKKNNNCKVCDVIVTSGRGIPDNVPTQARFISLSNIMNYAIERKSKFYLIQTLLSARRAKK